MSYNRRPKYGQNNQKRHFGAKQRRNIKQFDPRKLIHNMSLVASHAKQNDTTPEAVNTFNDFDIHHQLKSIIKSRGFEKPTLIQDGAIPLVISGSDIVGISKTGSGKTGAFLIPLINKVLANKNSCVLIVAPTRELAIQIEDEFKQFSKGINIKSAVCIGGVNINGQIRSLAIYPQFVIGTPGRLLDLAKQHKLDFRIFDSVVLDEVDRMLDMGFIHDITSIIKQLPNQRQSLFFSATLDNRTKSVMGGFLQNPTIISIESNTTNLDITQEVVEIQGRDKNIVLQDILDQKHVEKTIIFVRTKRNADKLSKQLKNIGFRTTAMHGNKSQNQRQRSLEQFKNSSVDILIATDVAARGIDVDDVSHVINFDLPETQEDYIHRIGRTGRSGKKGTAISFIG